VHRTPKLSRRSLHDDLTAVVVVLPWNLFPDPSPLLPAASLLEDPIVAAVSELIDAAAARRVDEKGTSSKLDEGDPLDMIVDPVHHSMIADSSQNDDLSGGLVSLRKETPTNTLLHYFHRTASGHTRSASQPIPAVGAEGISVAPCDAPQERAEFASPALSKSEDSVLAGVREPHHDTAHSSRGVVDSDSMAFCNLVLLPCLFKLKAAAAATLVKMH